MRNRAFEKIARRHKVRIKDRDEFAGRVGKAHRQRAGFEPRAIRAA